TANGAQTSTSARDASASVVAQGGTLRRTRARTQRPAREMSSPTPPAIQRAASEPCASHRPPRTPGVTVSGSGKASRTRKSPRAQEKPREDRRPFRGVSRTSPACLGGPDRQRRREAHGQEGPPDQGGDDEPERDVDERGRDPEARRHQERTAEAHDPDEKVRD